MRHFSCIFVMLSLFLTIGCDEIRIDIPGQTVAEETILLPKLQPELTHEVLFFTTPGCLPCERARSQVEELRKQGMKVTEVDIYKHPDLTHQYQITKTPTFIVLENGVEIERTSSISALIIILVKVLAWILPFLLG